jgi:hypothetical protein
MITDQVKRRAVLLIAASLGAVLLFAGWLSDMTLAPGVPLTQGAAPAGPGQQPQIETIGVILAPPLWVVVSILGGVYLAASLLRRITLRQMLKELLFILAFVILFSLLPPVIPIEPELLPDLMIPEEAVPLEEIESVPPPPGLVRALQVAALLLALLLGAALLRRAFQHPSPRQNVLREAELALTALQEGQELGSVIIRCYLQMQKELAERSGVEVQAWLTPHEFLEKMAALGLPAAPTRTLTHLFEEVRYGRKPAGPAEEQLALRCLDELVHGSPAGEAA